MCRILIFGTGNGYEKMVDNLKENIKIIALIDNNVKKHGGKKNNLPIISPLEIFNYEFDFIVIASQFFDEIENQLLELGVERYKIVPYYKLASNHHPFNEFISSKVSFDSIVTGISYAYYGIEPTCFSNNMFNLALNSQDLYHDFEIIKYLFENYKRKMSTIKNVIITLQYYSFDYEQKKRRGFKENYSKLYSFLEISNYCNFVNNYIRDKGLFYISEYKKIENNNYIQVMERKMDSSDIKFFYKNKGYYKKEFNKDFPDSRIVNRQILSRFLTLLKKNNVKSHLVVLPQSKYIQSITSNESRVRFYKEIEYLSSLFSFQFMDYFYNKNFEDKDFFDISHLNKSGALKFSRILEQDITWN